MSLLTVTLYCTIIGHTDVLGENEDLSDHPHLFA